MPHSPNFQSAINKWATKVGWWCKKVTCGEIYWDKNLYLVAQTDCKVAHDDRVKGYLYWGLIDCILHKELCIIYKKIQEVIW